MAIRILQVAECSPAFRSGIRAGDLLLNINNEDIIDEIDYQALTSCRILTVETEEPSGKRVIRKIVKKQWEPFGLSLDETVAMKPRHCCNRCVFCFIDQLPKNMRETMYVKDDDWRLSLMMGNYVTLTNVNDSEFSRILRRKASPLYISVHATDPHVRCQMMNNPNAGLLMDRLNKLRDSGICFHAQVVLCPGINDGNVLEKTVRDLSALYPFARSLAIVPVGLTRHRSGLSKLLPFTPDSAAALLDKTDTWQQEFLSALGTRFVFPSDEFYCLSGRTIPEHSNYEDYPQIENGVGMLRLLSRECEEYISDNPLQSLVSPPGNRNLIIATGVSAAPHIESLVRKYKPEGTEIHVIPVINRFFGESVTVTGLIVGQDLVASLQGVKCDEILISETMLRENTDSFLDDMTVNQVESALQCPVRVVRNNGQSLIDAIYGVGGVR